MTTTRLNPRDYGLKFQRKLKVRKPAKKAGRPEAVLQEQVEAYCAALGLQTFHMPEYVLNAAFGWNANRTGPELGAMRDAAEEVRGLPDLLIFHPMYPGRLKAIELKTEVGKMTSSQKTWQVRLGTSLCRSFEAARAEVDMWVEALK